MEKQALIKSMNEYMGGIPFMNQSQLAKYLKRSRDYVRELTEGLDYLQTGRENRYFVPDIAQRLMDQRRTG